MFLRKTFFLLVPAFLVLSLSSCSRAESSVPADHSGNAAGDPVSPAGNLPRLVDLGADKCIPCKMMAPVLEELKKEYAGRLEVEFIDVWKHREKAAEYSVQMIPTQIFFDESGKELFRRSGFIVKEDILAKWRELGYDFTN